MKKACIFDLDGTLTDTLATLAYFVNSCLAKYGIEKIEKERFKYLAGDGARNLIKRSLALRLDSWDMDFENKILTEYNTAYDADFMHLCSVYDGIPDLLEALKAKKIKLAVLTNKPQSTARKTVETFLGKTTFDIILGQGNRFPIKPDPSACLEIMRELKVLSEDCLYIGDTATDMKTGTNAKCFTVGVLWGFRERKELEEAAADAIIEKPEELLNFI